MMSDYSKMNYYRMDIDCTMVNDNLWGVTQPGESEANVVAKKSVTWKTGAGVVIAKTGSEAFQELNFGVFINVGDAFIVAHLVVVVIVDVAHDVASCPGQSFAPAQIFSSTI